MVSKVDEQTDSPYLSSEIIRLQVISTTSGNKKYIMS